MVRSLLLPFGRSASLRSMQSHNSESGTVPSKHDDAMVVSVVRSSRLEKERLSRSSTLSRTSSKSKQQQHHGILKHQHHSASAHSNASCDGHSVTGHSVASAPVQAHRRWPDEPTLPAHRFFGRTKNVNIVRHEITVANEYYNDATESSSLSHSSRNLPSTTATTVTSPTTSLPTVAPRRRRRVHHHVAFGAVEIRRYPRIVGDNPACSSGPPVSMDWSPDSTETTTVDAYEQVRGPHRRPEADLILPHFAREELLLFEWNVSVSDLATAVARVVRIQASRRKSSRRSGGGGGAGWTLGTTSTSSSTTTRTVLDALVERTTQLFRDESWKRSTHQALDLERQHLAHVQQARLCQPHVSTATRRGSISVQSVDESEGGGTGGGTGSYINPKDDDFDYAAYYGQLVQRHGNSPQERDPTSSSPPRTVSNISDSLDMALYTSTPRDSRRYEPLEGPRTTPRSKEPSKHERPPEQSLETSRRRSSRRHSRTDREASQRANRHTQERQRPPPRVGRTAPTTEYRIQPPERPPHSTRRSSRDVWHSVPESVVAAPPRRSKRTVPTVQQDIVVRLPALASDEVHFVPDAYLVAARETRSTPPDETPSTPPDVTMDSPVAEPSSPKSEPSIEPPSQERVSV